MSIDTSPSAFPMPGSDQNYPEFGLSKREYFAAMAMQGVLADSYIMDLIRCDDDKDTASFVAGLAVEYADALFEALEKT